MRVLEGYIPAAGLVVAAYSSSSWQKFNTTLNVLADFAEMMNLHISWPVTEIVMIKFVDWASTHRKLASSSISAYVSNLKLIHKL